MKQKKIVVTGGHHNSALVIAEELRSLGHEVVWFGHKFTMWRDKEPGAEYKEVTEKDFRFIEIKAGKLGRPYHPLRLLHFPLGFVQASYQLVKLRPSLIVSFGGYLAVPVVFWGWLMRIPIVSHEQTVVYGLANRLIDHFAKKIFVSWPSSLKHFSTKKVVLTGLPLRKAIFTKKKGEFNFKNNLPTIYLTGGKQGSHVINQAVKEALPRLLKNYNLIHQSGSSTVHDDFNQLKKLRSKLPSELKKRYLLRDYIFQAQIGQAFAAADLVVSRAGAHITYEVAALGKPTLFIPLPWSRAGEQLKNAEMLAKIGLAEILPQQDLSAKILYQRIEMMVKNLKQYEKKAVEAKKNIQLDASQRIIAEIKKIL